MENGPDGPRVNVRTFGDEGDPDLLWVMGWGNTVESRHERWFVDRLVDAGFGVHAIRLPTNGTDFVAHYLDPLRTYREEVGDHRLVAHSMGGLAVAHLRPDEEVVYLSPWWELAEDTPAVATLLFALPISKPIVPTPFDPDALGGLATEEDRTAPERLSPAWLKTMRTAQTNLPPIDPGDVVFYSPDDRVVSPTAIEAHADETQLQRYEGGHELFASEGREEHVERVVGALTE